MQVLTPNSLRINNMHRFSLLLLYITLAVVLVATFLVLANEQLHAALSQMTGVPQTLLGLLLVGFPVVLIAVIHTAQQLVKALNSLQLFVDSAERGLIDYDHIHFPEGQLGALGRKIVETYHRAEQNRKAAEREREKKRAYKQRMSNNITHELRTPVAAIQGYLEMLVHTPQLDAQRQQHFLTRAYAQSQRLTALIRDVALITKMEEAAELIPREHIELDTLLNDVATDLSDLAQEHALDLENRLPQGISLMGNYSLLYAILRNLIENSLKYAAPCRCIIELIDQNPTHLHLRYRDTGKGVPEEHLSRIFDRFYRPDEGRTRSNTDGGSGLGLSIVRNAVLFHGGVIRASNHPEGGLMFDFTLRLN